jgi:hypothetical protein
LNFKYCFILQLLESLCLSRTVSVTAGAAVSVATFAGGFCSCSLSEPLSESPSTIAAVTKDKILSIDLTS